ncbi:YidH family protein [Quadrisphaera sp. GCM10027208]|uniref:YidH family protein n=1 Tax=Quadrisphaera sp. GCM10027208 TaxID=3273423 RepID=UPI0036117E15
MTSRWGRSLLAQGRDPDPRFTMANERTFLAWIRTALALLAAGVGLEVFLVEQLPALPRRVIAGVLVLLGGALAVSAFTRWLATERALRLERSLPVPAVAPVLAAGIALTALVLLGVLLTTG